MKEYSLQELEEMQEKALERVRRMQQHSDSFLKETEEEAKKAEAPPVSMSPQKAVSSSVPEPPPQKSGRISMPLNLPKAEETKSKAEPVYQNFAEYFAPHNENIKAEKKKEQAVSLLDAVLQGKEEVLLFCLVLLLKAEGANETLLLALLYILF